MPVLSTSIAVQARVVRLGADGVGLAFVLRPSQDHKDRQAGRSPQELAAIGADKRTLDRFLRPLLAERVVGPGGELARISSSREPGREVMKILCGESGQATIFAVLSMTVLLGFVGFAADVGVLLHTKRNVQTAADSAAIAGAAELGYTDLTYSAAGQAAATQNGFTNGVNGAVVTINNPPLYGAHAGAGNAAFVEAIVSQDQPTIFAATFAALFHGNSLSTMKVVARAVATNGPGEGCLYLLGPSGADLTATGNASISAPSCGINVNSNSSNAVDLTGNVTVTAKSIAVVATGIDETGNVTISPTPVTGAVPSANPLAYLQSPTYSSCSNAIIQSGTTHLGPATPGGTVCYNGISATGNQVVDLSPGTYVLNGDLQLTGNVSLSGTGVTLDLLGNVNITGNATLDLTAPTTGAYAGILVYQTSANNLNLTGNAGSTLEGVIYAPNAAVNFTGNSASTIYTDFVVQSLTLVGNSSFQSYAALPGSVNPITAATLVE